ncbi:TPA: GTP pyrophosphokinase family protein [Providencia stuartii]
MSSLVEEYKENKHLYQSLLIQAKHSIESLLRNEDIEIFSIEARLKDENSFKEKLQRKSDYKILSDIEDICGLRVICYYESDLKKLRKLISENFDVVSSSDKKEESDVEKFGYSSSHFIARFKDNWLQNPIYNDLGGLKFEIQIRTILMHTWAAISHKTLYKQESDAPRHIRRTFGQLSALIELADEQFSRIKELKISYIDSDNFKELELNSDTLLELMSKYFPDRDMYTDSLPWLLTEIRTYDTYVSEFEERITKCLPFLNNLEHDCASLIKASVPIWSTVGTFRMILILTSPGFYNEEKNLYTNEINEILERYIQLVMDS